jgi:hypothetical protein
MKSTTTHPRQDDDGQLGLPQFERFPFRTPEKAVYRKNVPPRVRGNPVYEALPGPRSPEEVWNLIKRDNPVYDPSVRDLSPTERRERIDDVLDAIFPMSRQADLEDMLLTTVRNAYVGRNPAESMFMETNVAVASSFGSSPSSSGCGPVGAGCFIGETGIGKTETLKRLLRNGCPQVILHDTYQGRALAIQQLAWLYLSCPPKASISALICWIAAVIDYIFKTDVLVQVQRARNDSSRGRILARALSLHVTGIVVIDEIQNIRVGSPNERRTFENFLQELVNTTRTRFVFVGTPEVFETLDNAAMIRRLEGERGSIRWYPFSWEDEWDDYLRELWRWQVTKKETLLDDVLSKTMYDLTGGNPSYATRLWTKAQAEIIGHPAHPDERITTSLLKYTMENSFSATHLRVQERLRISQIKTGANSSHGTAPDLGNVNPVKPPTVDSIAPITDGCAPVGFNIRSVLTGK